MHHAEAFSLRGDKVGLRARLKSDVPILLAELYDDVVGASRSSSRPWLPVSPDEDSPAFSVKASTPGEAHFSIVELASGELAGEGALWGVDLHNRNAQIGLSLRPSFRGRGLGTDAVRILTRYGFATRGLHRLQIGTLADNHAMMRSALSAGFTQEGVLREHAWVDGAFVDEVLFGRLRTEG